MSDPDFQQMTRREIEDFLIEKSLIDPDFRERLIAAPRETLSGLGLPVGPDVKINVLVEKPGEFSVVLPRVLGDSQELTPDQLERVAGGVHTPLADLFRGYL